MATLRPPDVVLGREFLEARSALVELAGMLDRYQRSVEAHDAGNDAPEIAQLHDALRLLAEESPEPNRTERILMLFTDPE